MQASFLGNDCFAGPFSLPYILVLCGVITLVTPLPCLGFIQLNWDGIVDGLADTSQKRFLIAI